MPFENVITLKNGESVTLRFAKAEDAASLIGYLTRVWRQTYYLLTNGTEQTYTVSDEENYIASHAENTRNFLILAETNGTIIGNCSFEEISFLKRVRHRCSLGIVVDKKYQGMGLGRVMMCFAIEFARQKGYEQMELEVVSGNDAALGLYKSLGFEQTGIIPRAIKYAEKDYADIIIMVKNLT